MTDDVALRMMEHFDLHDPVLAKDGVPHRVYTEMRDKYPVHKSDAHGGYWVASQYQDVDTCPVQGFKRTARTEAQVGGKTVQPGERVLMLFASANFDEREFDRPNEVNIRRTTNRHMTFGRGIHRCLGSHLARREVKVMIQQVLQRIPEYKIDESKLEVHPDVGVAYGYESVPMRFTSGPRHG